MTLIEVSGGPNPDVCVSKYWFEAVLYWFEPVAYYGDTFTRVTATEMSATEDASTSSGAEVNHGIRCRYRKQVE